MFDIAEYPSIVAISSHESAPRISELRLLYDRHSVAEWSPRDQ
jgi:hypothetical protein